VNQIHNGRHRTPPYNPCRIRPLFQSRPLTKVLYSPFSVWMEVWWTKMSSVVCVLSATGSIKPKPLRLENHLTVPVILGAISFLFVWIDRTTIEQASAGSVAVSFLDCEPAAAQRDEFRTTHSFASNGHRGIEENPECGLVIGPAIASVRYVSSVRKNSMGNKY